MSSQLLLAVAGAGLLCAQYVASRELGSTFFVTELSVLAAAVVTLAGPSLGYAIGNRVRRAVPSSGEDAGTASKVRLSAAIGMSAWAAAAVLIHLLLPVGIRVLVGLLGASHVGLCGALVACFVALLCGYYAVLLPLRAEPTSLPKLYSAELLGSVIALLLIGCAPSWRVFLIGYFSIPFVIIWLCYGWRLGLITGLLAASCWGGYGVLDVAAARRYFVGFHGHHAPQIVQTLYSPYQRIDVVDDAGARSLYLDGVPFYRAGDLDSFNVFLAGVPGSLIRDSGSARRTALVVGSGSFSSAAKLHQQGYQVTVIELDAAVADVGFRRFAQVHQLQVGQVEVIQEDVRRALSRMQTRYDLIVLDVPAPYRVQTALLHTPAFYRQVASHLTEGGVVALSLCDELAGPLGSRIAAAAGRVFAEVMVVESNTVGMAVLYAGQKLPFDEQAAASALRLHDAQGGRVLSDRSVRIEMLGAAPISEKDLLGVLLLARQVHLGH